MKGTSYTYFTTDNAKQARELIGILRESKSEVPPELEQMAMFSGGGGGGRSSSSHSLAWISLILIQAVTVPVVAVVEVGVDADVVVVVVTTVADTVEVEVEGVAGVTVEEELEEGGATDGELILIAMIRLILYNLSRFGSAIDQP